MPDVFTKRKRSEVMSRIRGRGNKDTEIALAKLLRKFGIKGWRRQQKLRIEGKTRRAGPACPTGGDTTRRAQRSRPTNIQVDFLFPKQRVAIFVDGCFWHGCRKHSPPHRWIAKSSMRGGKLSAVSGQPSVVREGCTNGYQTETARQRSFDGLRMTNGREGKVTGVGRKLETENRQLRTGPSTSLRTGKTFWREKMASNIARDRLVNRELRRNGWRVVRIWEHELQKRMRAESDETPLTSAANEFRGMKVAEKIRKLLNIERGTLND
jgi:G:T-mismatch repair DNA endonuclease (very short patch repair protein)